MDGNEDIDIVRRVIEAIGELDMETAFALLADDVVLELPFRDDGGPPLLVGDEARRFMGAMPKLFASLGLYDIVVHGALPTGEIVAEYRSNGMTKAGRGYPNRYVSFFTVVDGRVTRLREFFNPAVVAAAFSA